MDIRPLLIDTNISSYPDKSSLMTPTEASYRNQYRQILSQIENSDALEIDLTTKKEEALQAYNEATKDYFAKEKAFFALRLVCFIVFTAVFVALLILFLDSSSLGLILCVDAVVSIILYFFITKYPRDAHFNAVCLQSSTKEQLTKAEDELEAFKREMSGFSTKAANLKLEFETWASKRNNYIRDLSDTPIYQYLGFPYEPILDHLYYPLGTDEDDEKYLVYIHHKYHRSQRCSNTFATGDSLFRALDMGLEPCQTCCRSPIYYPGWVKKVHTSYRDLIQDLKTHDISVCINSNRHLELQFITPGKQLSLSLNYAAKFKELTEKEQALKNEDARISERLRKLLAFENDLKERESHISEASPHLIETAFSDIFNSAGNAFYQSQAMALNRYYERVKDKRFEKAMIEGVHYTTGPAIICRIKSNDKGHPAPYITSLSTCTCQDFRRHKQPCKHMLFLAYHTGYLFLNKEKLESSLQQYIDELKEVKPKDP